MTEETATAIEETKLSHEQVKKTVAGRLLTLRKARGYSRNKLNAESGVHYDIIRRIEEGTRYIELTVLFKLCAALDADPSEVISTNYSLRV